jgi:hypothetical protein
MRWDVDVICIDKVLKPYILRTVSHYYNFNIKVYILTFLFACSKWE